MPHSTSTGSHMRAASQHRSSSSKPHGETNDDNATEKFPDFDAGIANGQSGVPLRTNSHAVNSSSHESAAGDRWQARRDSRFRWAQNTPAAYAQGQNRRTSISQAFRHMRSASVSHNAQEIAGALRAPVSWKLIVIANPLLPGWVPIMLMPLV